MANQRWNQLLVLPAGWPDAGRISCWLIGIAMVSLVWTGITYQSAIHLNHDVAWIAHSAAWLLDGKKFGGDIIDPSPPLIWFLSLPAAFASRQGLADEVTSISVSFWLINFAILMICFRILMKMVRTGLPMEAIALGIASSTAICLLPAGIFGQRDVLSFTLGLPYLLQIAYQLDTRATVSTRIAIASGFLAGIGFCLKPYLLAVPLLVELFRAWKMHDFRFWLRSEIIAIAAVVLAYVVVLFLATPDYLSFVLPLIKASYWAYDGSQAAVLQRFLEAITPAVLAIALSLATRSMNAFHAVLVAGVAGASISYWLQNKGFSYHWYPVVATSCVLLTYTLAVAAKAVYRQLHGVSLPLTIGAIFALIYLVVGGLQAPLDRALAWYGAYDRETGEQGQEYEALIRRLRALGIGPGSYLFAISTHPKPGFPATSYLGANWAGEAATQFVLPAYVRRDEIVDVERLKRVMDGAKYQREAVVNALDRHRPQVVLVDARTNRLGLGYRRFDQVAFYAEGDRFRQIWACYSELEAVSSFRIFQLQNPSCWPAGPALDTN